ncbi:GlcG/HbpS family heme-binding protein [Methyloferula stellata]|uniref:GlcG/HbpS family heme-binding protein n=1 Tax=Methyloferula stellata TaxID=876270 RepID=UPI00037FC9C7|nr:heme-binding protein [Methyloferula stellata]
MFQKPCLSLTDAKAVAAAAVAEVVRNGWTVVVAVVDDGGHLLYLERMDGAPKISAVIAPEKAKTAILFKRPSVALENVVAGGRIAILSLPGATMVEGGLPIVVEGEFIGAVGVSGMQLAQDGIVAAAGLSALNLG